VYRPPANLPNHTCKPNLFHNFTSRSVVLRAKEEIKKGEDVTISYLDGGEMGVKERNDYYEYMWGFRCGC